MIFEGKKNKVVEMMENYLAKFLNCLEKFRSSIDTYFKSGISEEFKKSIEDTHIEESLADDIRREIELTIYEKALIPESRGDILGIIESTDKILNKAQSVLYQIYTEFLKIPDFLKEDIKELVEINIDASKKVIEGIETLFSNIRKVKDVVKEIDKKESYSDRKERETILKIFSSQMDIGSKILLKELVIEIGEISDLSEEVGDRLNITAAKRLI